MKPIPERLAGNDEGQIPAASDGPLVIRGLVADWPSVAAGQRSARDLADYILQFDDGRPVDVMVGPPEIAGRFFYRDDMRGFNFHREKVPMETLIKEVLRLIDEENPHSLYAGATATPDHLTGWSEKNSLPFQIPDAIPRVWIGNSSRVSLHFDLSSNIACVVAGRRRFTLFPPEQLRNLYIGPLENTMAGQPSSMLDIEQPDLQKHPRFAEAATHALVADLEPGDAIFIPTLWWHEVRASAPFNVLVNYWYGQSSASPFDALIHSLLAIRDLPAEQREAWRAWFDQYIFSEDNDRSVEHLPSHARGVLGPPSDVRTELITRYLLKALSRR